MKLSPLNTLSTYKGICVSKVKRLLTRLDDECYLKLLYFFKFGKRLNLSVPRSFNEKLQWLKLHDRRDAYTRMVDKYEAKSWAAERIGDQHIVPSLGVWDSFAEIDFDTLPNQFVLKCTHDSGGLVICKDKQNLNFRTAEVKISKALQNNFYYSGREWPYKNVKPRVLAEVYIPSWNPNTSPESAYAHTEKQHPSDFEKGILDYKFYCFNGEPRFLYVSRGLHEHSSARMDFLDLNWERTLFTRPDFASFETLPPKPSNFDSMIELAKTLAHNIPFVRVDLFEHMGQILFSEMTLTPASGMMKFSPSSADLEIGRLLKLPI